MNPYQLVNRKVMERKMDFLRKFKGIKDEDLGRGRLKVSVNHMAKPLRKMGRSVH